MNLQNLFRLQRFSWLWLAGMLSAERGALLSRPGGNFEHAFDQAILWMTRTSPYPSLPAFYTLHVWAWKENRKGAFVNWHPAVSCQAFVGQTTP
jgi:hypothetical protein